MSKAEKRRFLERLRAPVVASEAQRVERLLAAGRAFLAGSALFAIWMDPTEPSRYATIAYGLLILYLVHSLCVLGLVRIHHESTSAFRLTVHAVDVFWPALISLFTTGPNSPFFVFNAFVLLAAAYRWGFRETLATAGAALVFYYSQAILIVLGPPSFRAFLEGEFELNRFIIRGLYLPVMGYLLGYLGEEEKRLRAESSGIARIIGKAQGEIGLRSVMRAVLDELLRAFRATEALVVLREDITGRAFRWHAARNGENQELQLHLRELEPSERAGYFFDAPGHAWYARRRNKPHPGGQFDLVAVDEAGARLWDITWMPPEPFLKAHDFRSLVGVLVNYGREWSGHLLLIDPDLRPDRETALRFCQTLVRQASPAIYNVYLVRRLRSRIGAAERARVARELHDGVTQSLVGLEMQVDVLRRRCGATSHDLEGELDRIQHLLRQEVVNLRDLTQHMKPLDLGPKQILDFLADTVERFRRETGIAASFVSAVDELDLPPRICNGLARIVQEALVNVRKHSGARNVLVRFDSHDGCWRLVIDDDGRGFAFTGRLAQVELDSTRQGPIVIKERVRFIGGELAVESFPGRGARLEIRVPQKAHG